MKISIEKSKVMVKGNRKSEISRKGISSFKFLEASISEDDSPSPDVGIKILEHQPRCLSQIGSDIL